MARPLFAQLPFELDDAVFDLETWLAGEIAGEFARAEGAAFISGSGTNQPKGFLAAPTSTANDAARAFGALQFIASGHATGLGSVIELALVDLVHALKAGHRQGACWVMNSATLASVRKLKAAKYVAEHPNEVCPAKWNDGAQTIKPSLDLVGKI